jgi:hypothetical protein
LIYKEAKVIPYTLNYASEIWLQLNECTKLGETGSLTGGAVLSSEGILFWCHGNTIYRVSMDTADPGGIYFNATDIYHHPNTVQDLKLRWWNGKEIVFFSSHPQGQPTVIYYLDEQSQAIPYYSIQWLSIPDPCNPGSETGAYYNGLFSFDDQNNLFVTLGNYKPTGIYRISGAGANGVTGEPERIYLGDEFSIWELECGYANRLYIGDTTGNALHIKQIDLSTLLVKHLISIPDAKRFTFMSAPHTRSGARYHVKWLQFALNQVLGTQLAVDGLYGPLTTAAVVQFQKAHFLKPDGLAGPLTFKKLRPLLDMKFNPSLAMLNLP